MQIDRSSRVWAIRGDDVVAAQALQLRADRAEGREPLAVLGADRLKGSDFAQVVDGVAIVPIKGPLMRSFTWWSWSYEEIARDLALARADKGVKSIILDVDSPGGIVAGCGDLAAMIRGITEKPVHAFVGGVSASAAYWLTSAAQSIRLGSGASLGSIGTVIEYVDMEPVLEKMGAKIVRVVAEQSPNKRLESGSPEEIAEFQAMVDASAAEFIDGIAAGRGVSAKDVLDTFGQGLMFEGNEAIRRGMADSRTTLDDMVAELAGRDFNPNAVAAAAAKEKPMDWANLTLAALREHRPDLVTDLEASARAGAEQAGATTERQRILGLDEIAVAGHEELVAAAKADGKTTPAELALKIVKADKASGAKHLEQRAAADVTVPVVTPPTTTTATEPTQTQDQKIKATWDANANLQAEFGGNFDAYAAFEKAAASGQARILRVAS